MAALGHPADVDASNTTSSLINLARDQRTASALEDAPPVPARALDTRVPIYPCAVEVPEQSVRSGAQGQAVTAVLTSTAPLASVVAFYRQRQDSHDDAREVVAQMNRLIEEIKQLMGSMFDRYIETTDGRDSVTRLLNRRYFPAVAKREIELAQRQQSAFALLGIEIDGFDALRGALGLDGSDTVLAGVAEGLLDSVRAGDFVFRVGDARFLVLLVETSVDALPQVADGLRRQVESLRLRTASRASPSVTVSIGAALFDGHPDYQRLLDRADAALKAALASGANRCVVDA